MLVLIALLLLIFLIASAAGEARRPSPKSGLVIIRCVPLDEPHGEVAIEFHYLDIEAPGTSAALRDGEAVFEPGFSQRAVGGAAEADVRAVVDAFYGGIDITTDRWDTRTRTFIPAA